MGSAKSLKLYQFEVRIKIDLLIIIGGLQKIIQKPYIANGLLVADEQQTTLKARQCIVLTYSNQ